MEYLGSHRTLSTEELQEFKEIFNLVDKDQGGSITRYELGQLLKTLGLNASDDNIEKIMRECDTDGSGDIDFIEFIDVMSKKVNLNYSPSQLQVAFEIFATDDTPKGYIKTESLEKALTIWGSDRISSDKAVELIAAIDPNSTGKVNISEYIKLMSNN